MSTVYENLKALSDSKKTLVRRGKKLILQSSGSITLATQWGISAAIPIVTISPKNIATFHARASDSGINMIFGQLGLGSITNGRTTKARLMYWINGAEFVYVPEMQVDLTTNKVINAKAVEDIAIDTKKRSAFLKLVRTKVPLAQAYIRLSGKTRNFFRYNQTGAYPAPEDFIRAIKEEDAARIAEITIRCNRAYRISEDIVGDFDKHLNSYIDQNRAELYRLAGVTA